MLRHALTFGSALSKRPDESKLADGQRALRLVQAFEQQLMGWVWETDTEGRITYLSPSIAATFDYRDGYNGEGITDLLKINGGVEGLARSLSFYLVSHSAFRDVPVLSTRGGAETHWSISGQPQVDAAGRFIGFVGLANDLTERRRSQQAITQLAFTDTLTGLANRQRMKDMLDHLLSLRTSGFNPTALLLLDLDHFKLVNDTLGHPTGDELLKQVGQRLQHVVGDAGMVGRLGGDEFQIICASDNIRDTVDHLAATIIHAVSEPYFINDSPVRIGCSIGIAIAPEHGRDAETLVQGADLSLYSAKDKGRKLHRVFSPDLLETARERKRLEDDLRHALSAGEMHLAYQPVVSTTEPRLVGYEALIRWTHPVHGAISPTVFIPIAEECGLIGQLGEWVLRTATEEAASWPAGTRIAVNVSPIQFMNQSFAASVARALAFSGLAANRLELEITESVFLRESDDRDELFRSLKRLGVRLVLDDFGTGYSSLGYLKSAPFDKIKIDQGFVKGAITPGSRNAAIIRAIVMLADVLGMETTAEGVEQQDEIELVRTLGCTQIQGYVYGKPMAAESVRANFAENGTVARPVGFRVSRSPRTTVFRAARLRLGEAVHDIHIRNMSSDGFMIEGVDLAVSCVGQDVVLDLAEGHMIVGYVRWTRNGRAGIEIIR